MTDLMTYARYAVLYELSSRDFRRKLALFPPEARYNVILAGSIVGSANADRMDETLPAVAESGKEFVSKLIELADPEQDAAFREILETYLIEAMKDELRFCCANCVNFDACIGLEHLTVGLLFRQRTEGDESEELKREIARQTEAALLRARYLDSDRADLLCSDFRHQYSAAAIGTLFGRYAEIAAELRHLFGADFGRLQQAMIAVNMEFMEKSRKKEEP